MSDDTQTPAEDADRIPEIKELANVLVDDFAAVLLAARHLREESDEARRLPEPALLQVLSQLRVGRAIDDLTAYYLDAKEQEARTAQELLDELDDDEDAEEEFEDEFEDEEFEEDEFEDDDEDEDDEEYEEEDDADDDER